MPEKKEPHTDGTGAFWTTARAKHDDLEMSKEERKDNANVAIHDERDFYYSLF